MLLCSVIIIFKLFYYSAFPRKNHPQIQLFAHLFLSIFSPENAKTHMRGHIEMHPRIKPAFFVLFFFFRRFPAVFTLIIIVYRALDGFFRQHGAVDLLRRQPFERLYDGSIG